MERNSRIAKFWLDPVRLQNSGGFDRVEIVKIHKLVGLNQKKLMEAWHDYFGH
jgi:hypothetical protein